MWAKTSVQITMVICATVLCLTAFAGVLALVLTDRAAETFSAFALGMLGLVLGRWQGDRAAAKRNGDSNA